MILFSLILIFVGTLYLVFAYRDPPNAIDHLFRVPAIFVFLPDQNRLKLGRIITGAFLVVSGCGWLFREIYRLLLG